MFFFFNFIGIPIITCFAAIIERTVQRCFNIPSIDDLFVRVAEFLQAHSDFVVTATTQPPTIHENFWLTKYNYLEYFTTFYANTFEPVDVELNDMIEKIKLLIDCISPFKVQY